MNERSTSVTMVSVILAFDQYLEQATCEPEAPSSVCKGLGVGG